MRAEITSSAKREEELSKSDYISLSWNSAEKVVLPVGAYINHTYKIDKVREVTRRFLLLEEYEPTQTDEMSWKYTPVFQHPKMVLSKVPFYIRTRNSQNEEIKQHIWSFVGTMATIADKLKDFLNHEIAIGNAGWTVHYDETNSNTINVSFNDNDFISALSAIANAIGDNCEWHIDYDNEVIHLGKVSDDNGDVVLKVGENVGVPSISNSKESYYNSFAVFGGSRNITQLNNKGENISSSDIRLQLDKGGGSMLIDGKDIAYTIDEYSTIDLRQDRAKEPQFTKVLDFSDIFPSLNTYVYNVRGREKYVLDNDTKEKIPLTYNTDGSVATYKTFTVWYMRLAYPTTEKVADKELINTTIDDGVTHYWYDFEITDNLLINGKNIGCSFEANFNKDALSTPLAGRGSNGNYVGFELTYHKEASSSHSSDDVSGNDFSVLAGDYEIVYQEDNGLIIPTNAVEMIVPKGEALPSLKCNITVLYNIVMADSIYIKDAQQRLFDAAIKEIQRLRSDLNNYTIKSYPQVFVEQNPCLQIGQKVTYDDGNGYTLSTRVLKLSTNIDYNFIQEITVGNQAIKGTITQLKDDVQSIIASGGGNGSGCGGYTESQLKNLIARYGTGYFLSKQFNDTAQGLITFAKGLISEMLAQLKGGATFGNNGYRFDKDGNVVVDTLHSLAFDEALEQGFGFTKNARGKYTLSVTDLLVWGKAVFNSLEIRKLYSVGGNVYLSGASSKLQHVVPVTDADGEVTGWKCYILGDDGTTATQNGWARYDQAKCQTFDIKEGVYENVSNTYYWRLVTDVSTENEAITETRTEKYVDEDGQLREREVTVDLYDGKKFGWVILSKTDCESAANDAPKAGDTIVLDGHRMFASGDPEGRDQYNDESRTNVMMLETTGVSGGSLPRIVALTGITDYRHSDGKNEYSNTVFILSPKEVVFVSSSIKWISASGDPITFVNFRGNWATDTKYAYYDQVSHNNAIWTCVVEKGTTTTEEPSDTSKDWRKEISGGKGDKGDPGTPGNGIDHVETRFFAWKSDTFGPGFDSDRVWEDGSTTMPPDFSDGFPWLWQVTRTYYTNGTDVLGEAVCIGYKGKDGAAGSDAVTYGVQVTPYLDPLSSGKTDPGIQIQFTRTTGATVETFTNVTKLGGLVMVYVDGVYHADATRWINIGNDKIVFSHFPIDNTSTDKTLGTASTIGIELLVNSTVVATANYANGKQGADGIGALEISVAPDTLVFDTNDNGIVPSGTSKTATIACYRDGKKVTNVEYALTEGGHSDCAASISTSNSTATVTISKIATDEPYGVSKTCGTVEVQVYDIDNGRYYFPTVKFSVNVAKFNGGLKADNKRFETTYNYLTNNGNDPNFIEFESKIRQTAKEISLHVSEKRAGRRNLLPGSAFRKQGEGCEFKLGKGGYGIQAVGGYEGTNCVRALAQGDNYAGVYWWGNNGTNKNIKIKRNTRYTLSVWAKAASVSVLAIMCEAIYEKAETGFARDGRVSEVRHSYPTIRAGEWQQFMLTVQTDGSHDWMECNFWATTADSSTAIDVLFCRPMLEEGDEYNGWTLSEQDYDYVGGNLLDGTATLAKTGNVEVLNPGNVTQGGMGESASIKAELLPTVKEVDFLRFSTVNMGIKANEDYVLSFYAKTEGNAGKLQCYLYPSEGTINTEDSDGGYDNTWNPKDGDLRYGIVVGTTWKRYWVHWRPTKADPEHVLFRLMRGGNDRGTYSSYTTYAVDDVVLYGGTYYRCIMAGQGNTPSSSSSYWDATKYGISLSQPKLEVGATMTEWTAKRSDMVDKQALYATGIDIDSKKIILTADHTYVRTNDGTPMVLIDADGNLTNVKVNADMVNVSATHKLSISGNGSMVVDMDNFKLDESGNASFKGSIDSKSGTISFFTFTDSGMYSATSSSMWGLGLRATNISVRGTPGGRTSLVCLGNGTLDTTSGKDNTYPSSLVDVGQNVNYCNLIQVTGGGSGNGRDAAALGIETQGDYCLSAMGGLSHLQGLALDASTISGSANRTLFLCSGDSFTMPSNPKAGQLVIVIQTTGTGITFYAGGKNFRKGASTSRTARSGTAGQWNFFVYDGSTSSWRCVYANGGLF